MDAGAIAKVVRAFAPAWVRRPATPGRMVLAITRRCNLRCATCHTYDLPPGDELTPAEIGRLCRNLPRLAWLDVTGGEPFMRRDVEEVFEAIHENARSLAVFHFPTNGWFGDRVVAAARRLRERWPRVELIVTVSVDGADGLHDRVRGREGSFARAIDTFRRLREVPGVRAYVGTTVAAHNRDELDALERRLRELLPGFDPSWWHWNLFQESELFFKNAADRTLRASGLPSLVRAQLKRRGVPRGAVDLMESMFLVNLDAWLRGEPLGFSCQALENACFVAADGRLYPCHVWDRPIADLRAEHFDVGRVWAREATRRAREEAEALACGGCFTPCEAYPAIAGSPLRAAAKTLVRALRLGFAPAPREGTPLVSLNVRR